jgi:predicted O-linked N-acetylglucosamine transferase (SPINDLY family)
MRFEDSIRFVPWQAHAAFFALLDRADVYLDSAGFSGFNTTMQAIERGTPVVAWEGEFMRGRFASGILRQAGLDEWVADSASGFVNRVERLCSESSLRDRVRGEIAARRSKLFDDRDSVAALARRLLTLSTSS